MYRFLSYFSRSGWSSKHCLCSTNNSRTNFNVNAAETFNSWSQQLYVTIWNWYEGKVNVPICQIFMINMSGERHCHTHLKSLHPIIGYSVWLMHCSLTLYPFLLGVFVSFVHLGVNHIPLPWAFFKGGGDLKWFVQLSNGGFLLKVSLGTVLSTPWWLGF